MRWLKLTAFSFLITTVTFISCKQEANLVLANYAAYLLPMNGAQEVPAVSTSATGSMNVTYSQASKILTYTLTWSGLSGNASAAHIHGTAQTGVTAGVIQSFTGFPATPAGTYSGTVYMDGIRMIESQLLSGEYYMNIHTAANGGGEIRGQILLKKL